MPTISEAFANALLADATYVHELIVNPALQSSLRSRMTPTLAAYIADRYSLVTQYETGDDFGQVGFDVTVWREIESGKLVVSMRGTEPITDFITDIDLAFTGNARLLQSGGLGGQVPALAAHGRGEVVVGAASVRGGAWNIHSVAGLGRGAEGRHRHASGQMR
jgi:hypothetical protein